MAAEGRTGMDNKTISFEQYVEHMIETDEKNPYSDPVCIFPYWNAECYVERRHPKFGCLNCPAARESYEKLDPEWAKKYMRQGE